MYDALNWFNTISNTIIVIVTGLYILRPKSVRKAVQNFGVLVDLFMPHFRRIKGELASRKSQDLASDMRGGELSRPEALKVLAGDPQGLIEVDTEYRISFLVSDQSRWVPRIKIAAPMVMGYAIPTLVVALKLKGFWIVISSIFPLVGFAASLYLFYKNIGISSCFGVTHLNVSGSRVVVENGFYDGRDPYFSQVKLRRDTKLEIRDTVYANGQPQGRRGIVLHSASDGLNIVLFPYLVARVDEELLAQRVFQVNRVLDEMKMQFGLIAAETSHDEAPKGP